MKWIIFILSAMLSCTQSSENKAADKALLVPTNDTVPPTAIAGNFSSQTELRFDSTRIDSFFKAYPLFRKYASDFNKFYSNRKYAYAWHNEAGLIEQSSILYNRILQIRDNGVNPNIPYEDVYKTMMEDAAPGLSTDRELMLTGQYLAYANKVLTGISDAGMKEIEWYIPRKKTDYASLLDSVLNGRKLDTGKLLFPQYYQLRDKLNAYYEIEKKNSWVTIRADRKKYQLGDSSEVVKEIRTKLYLAGDIANNNESPVFDQELANGIKEFQRRYGLKEDGVAGPGVLKEMSAPLSKRIEQILVNMERCRWLPAEEESNFLMVNIPQFKLLAVENEKITWSSDVVVGKATNKTVIFKGDMKYVVFSPYWNVPNSIAKNEIIPATRKNPNYLAKHNMEYYDGGKIRQKPGANNSLGLVKFLFPNSFNIYLHDTPAKALFNESKRAFSHGCIRVAKPLELAQYLLKNDPNWNEEKIRAAMNNGKEQWVTLKKTVPVYLVYLTAFVDNNGKLNFREDIYSRDQHLKEMLFSQNPPAIK
jgi:murein L,D-transpeptidase YcbB/YkuD